VFRDGQNAVTQIGDLRQIPLNKAAVCGNVSALMYLRDSARRVNPSGVAAAGPPGAVAELPPPGWYEDPQGTGLRWWDGSQWTELPPPGWYEDPQGAGWRWWDGSQWTEHWEGQAAATAALPSQAATSGDDRLGLALVAIACSLALVGSFLIAIAALRFI
jgi:hypothetical protein